VIQTQLNLEEGRRRKRDGQKLALEAAGPTWTELAMGALKIFLATRLDDFGEFRFEQFRLFCSGDLSSLHSINLPPPKSSAAWGALPRIAQARGLIRFTGRYEAARSPKTHAHPVKIWAAVNAN
jgi:hypothetical protein